MSRCLGTDAIDVVVLDTARGSELKYAIVARGRLLHRQEPYQVLVEPAIMNEYFDFRSLLERAG
ncbi:MAG: hypothetical protein COT71_00130 [Candidatus Andersenbacteria bacterium CG10_big_fil_rev_8_21_14_0_10_54_11]|uniref:Uncharacterized protein n=1 Tax=Candidatus Andersenbacteria bacterium CG10_big_fil_rev_8_21_14_0_10_54_11 TaxID=1974485 RepID=A0A2M6X0H9_9BACT|nr:MAG: hypothetical protein COT71_00130 [Candidatus Andersenbacteria bacterium CG10_big_fil_rev_8_21_14_0_10_54_11]